MDQKGCLPSFSLLDKTENFGSRGELIGGNEMDEGLPGVDCFSFNVHIAKPEQAMPSVGESRVGRTLYEYDLRLTDKFSIPIPASWADHTIGSSSGVKPPNVGVPQRLSHSV